MCFSLVNASVESMTSKFNFFFVMFALITKVSELPLKTYYRYVLPTKPVFGDVPLGADFAHLPEDRLLV